MAAGSGGHDTIAVSVHGPAGVLDLVVPPGADAADLARVYAAHTSATTVPVLLTRAGTTLPPTSTLGESGVRTGDVLVAASSVPGPHGGREERLSGQGPSATGGVAAGWFWCAAGLAVLAGWAAAHSGPGGMRDLAVGLLLAAAVVGVLPVGRHGAHRVLVAPAFAGAAVFAMVWDPVPERLPLLVGIAAMAAAATAAVGRALVPGPDEGLRVWMVAGVALFGLASGAGLLGLSAGVVWSVAILLAVLAARFVPLHAVDVPDQYLIDLDQLAVTAWSAREPRPGRRGRTVVRPDAVAVVAARATRTMQATAAAVVAAAVLSAHQLLTVVEPFFDRVGARFLVLLAGASLLLTARSHRHALVRGLLRAGGLACWLVLLVQLLTGMEPGRRAGLLGVAIGAGLLLVVAGVATGRGWRSVWWSRRAEVAEGLAAAGALASVVVSTGLFRALWEIVP